MTQSRPVEALSIIGVGRLGAPIAACFASKGYRVVGVDVDPERVSLVNQGRAPVFEPGLQELLTAHQDRVVATQDYAAAVADTQITFILTPTPSDEDGGFSLRHVLEACKAIGDALREKVGYHLVVLTSTVMPGATDSHVMACLEARSGKRCGQDFGLCYSPEFVALGSVIRDVFHPDFVLIGESDPKAGALLASFYRTICDNDPPVARMSALNAEITKLAVNTFVTAKISFANMLARICERLPGANVDAVTSALGLDGRIGPRYLKGAVGYGGPCFPRDNMALSRLAGRLGVPATLAEAADAMNRQQVPLLKELIKSRLPEGGRVGILGLSYKPNTDVIEESQGVELARALLAEGIPVVAYDPASLGSARMVLNGVVTFASSAQECARGADVLVIATPWEEFKALRPEFLVRRDGRPVLVDCWRILDGSQFDGVAEYIALGVGADSGERGGAPR